MNKISIILLWAVLIAIISCGEKPESQIEIAPAEIVLSNELNEVLGDSAQILIYSDQKLIAKAFLSEIKESKSFFVLSLAGGEHLIEVFLSGPNENVIYMLDKKVVNLIPDVKNSVDIRLTAPIKFDTKVLNLSLNQEVIVTAKIDSTKLPEGAKNPELHWTIDNIEGGNEELGTIVSNGATATIKGPSALPSSPNHYIGVYFEIEGRKYNSVIKINYIE